jgi:hypothetical protein
VLAKSLIEWSSRPPPMFVSLTLGSCVETKLRLSHLEVTLKQECAHPSETNEGQDEKNKGRGILMWGGKVDHGG